MDYVYEHRETGAFIMPLTCMFPGNTHVNIRPARDDDKSIAAETDSITRILW